VHYEVNPKMGQPKRKKYTVGRTVFLSLMTIYPEKEIQSLKLKG
jgi:hypothetical protein